MTTQTDPFHDLKKMVRWICTLFLVIGGVSTAVTYKPELMAYASRESHTNTVVTQYDFTQLTYAEQRAWEKEVLPESLWGLSEIDYILATDTDGGHVYISSGITWTTEGPRIYMTKLTGGHSGHEIAVKLSELKGPGQRFEKIERLEPLIALSKIFDSVAKDAQKKS